MLYSKTINYGWWERALHLDEIYTVFDEIDAVICNCRESVFQRKSPKFKQQVRSKQTNKRTGVYQLISTVHVYLICTVRTCRGCLVSSSCPSSDSAFVQLCANLALDFS